MTHHRFPDRLLPAQVPVDVVVMIAVILLEALLQ